MRTVIRWRVLQARNAMAAQRRCRRQQYEENAYADMSPSRRRLIVTNNIRTGYQR